MKIKNKNNFHDRFEGRKTFKYFIFTTCLGEKIKNFLFSLPSFGRDNKKKTYFSRRLGKEKIKILFIFITVFWERKNNKNIFFHDFWVGRK